MSDSGALEKKLFFSDASQYFLLLVKLWIPALITIKSANVNLIPLA